MADLSNGSSHSSRKANLVRPFSGRPSISKPFVESPLPRPAAPPFVPRLSLPRQTVSLPTPVVNVTISWTESAIEAEAQEPDTADAQQLVDATTAESEVEQSEGLSVDTWSAMPSGSTDPDLENRSAFDQTADDGLVDEFSPVSAASLAAEITLAQTEAFGSEPTIELADSIEIETLTIEKSDSQWPEDVPSLELATEDDEALYTEQSESAIAECQQPESMSPPDEQDLFGDPLRTLDHPVFEADSVDAVKGDATVMTPSEEQLDLSGVDMIAGDAEAQEVSEGIELPSVETKNAGAELASMLEAVAARVRTGEIPVSASATRNEAAALATVLAALLGHQD